jgi:tetratricopeptide (TPR) repeat protein
MKLSKESVLTTTKRRLSEFIRATGCMIAFVSIVQTRHATADVSAVSDDRSPAIVSSPILELASSIVDARLNTPIDDDKSQSVTTIVTLCDLFEHGKFREGMAAADAFFRYRISIDKNSDDALMAVTALLGEFCFASGDYGRAEQMLRRSMNQSDSLTRLSPSNRVAIAAALGRVLIINGQYDESLRILQRANGLIASNSEHKLNVKTEIALESAIAARMLGRLKLADDYCLQAQQLLNKQKSTDLRQQAGLERIRALIAYDRFELGTARAAADSCAHILAKAGYARTFDYINALMCSSIVATTSGDVTKGANDALAASELAAKLCSKAHPVYGTCLRLRAVTSHIAGNFPAASENLSGMIENHKCLAKDHPEVVADAIAAARLAKGRFPKLERSALRESCRPLRLRNERLTYAAVLMQLAELEVRARNFVDAKKLLAEAISIEREATGESSLRCLQSQCYLASVQENSGDHDEAERTLEAIEQKFTDSTKDSDVFAAYLCARALSQFNEGKLLEAEASARQSIALFASFDEPTNVADVNYGLVACLLGVIHTQNGEYQEAHKLFDLALSLQSRFTCVFPDARGKTHQLKGLAYIAQDRCRDALHEIDQSIADYEMLGGTNSDRVASLRALRETATEKLRKREDSK